MKKLRWKFTLAAVSAIFIVLALLVVGINLVYRVVITHSMDEMLVLIAENDGRIPAYSEIKTPTPGLWGVEFTEETPYETRYFVVRSNENLDVVEPQVEYIASVTGEDARAFFQEAVQSGRTSGYVGHYRFYRCASGDDVLFVFLDCSRQLHTSRSLLTISILVAVLALTVACVLAFLFSKKAISPTLRSMERQKQFVTDASHELKTPLTVIAACTDILALETPDSEWVRSIKNESLRLSKLVSELVTLSRWGEEQPQPEKSVFSLSRAVWDAIVPFQTLAEAKNRTFTIQVAEDVTCCGDEAALQKVVSILLDNAVKYSEEGGAIQLRLAQKRRIITLEVCNTCVLRERLDLTRLFDRFYRADSSRSRSSGGSGIGLSIAKAIVEAHGGTICAQSRDSASLSVLIRLPK